MIAAVFNDAGIGYFHNPNADRGAGLEASYPASLEQVLGAGINRKAAEEISRWPGYQPTPLLELNRLARKLGVGGIYYKDEGGRFGLGSFKSLGGAYGVLCLLQRELSNRIGGDVTFESIRDGTHAGIAGQITVVTATDGNHGRSVAWGADLFGCRCVIYIHREVSAGRKAAMEAFGASVVRIDGNYDDSVSEAAKAADANGWFVVSDTSYEGYTDLPRQVMAGYTVIASEVAAQLPQDAALTHVFVQAGVGGLAGALCARLWQLLKDARPRFIVVEPDRADCLFQSAGHNAPTAVDISRETIMAGLSCGKVSSLGWQILSPGADDFMTIPDELVAPVMRGLADSAYGAEPVVAGESAVAGVAALIAAGGDPDLRTALGLDRHSRILLVGTEGATDAEIYQAIVGRAAATVEQAGAAFRRQPTRTPVSC